MSDRLNRMLDKIDFKYDKSPGMFFYDILKVIDIALEEQDKKLESAKDIIDIEKLEKENLEKFIAQRTNILRNKATRAIAEVLIEGNPGSEINKGMMVSTGNINFFALENSVLPQTGKILINVICEEYGYKGNVPSGSIAFFPITIQGLFKVNNENPAKGGYEEEGDESLRLRYLERIRKPTMSGNKYDYKKWAKEVPGVGDADVIPLHNGNGTVTVIISDSNKKAPDQKLIDEVKNHIENERPICANVSVIGVKEKPLKIEVKITKTDENINEIKNRLEKSISKLLKEIAFELYFISHARIGKIILETQGILDYQNLKINGLTENLVIERGEVPVLKEVILLG